MRMPYIQEAFKRVEEKYGDVAEFHCAGGLPINEYKHYECGN